MGRVKEYYTKFPFDANGEYFRWLCEMVEMEKEQDSFLFLASALYKKEYNWSIPNDDNREADGKRLRIEYADDFFFSIRGVEEQPCSMLELLIGIAQRMEFQTDREMIDWFWEILGNLGLDQYTDDAYYEAGGPYEVQEILDRVIDRTFKRDGRGGLFPVKYDNKDQRKVEIWYQMHAYLRENYEF